MSCRACRWLMPSFRASQATMDRCANRPGRPAAQRRFAVPGQVLLEPPVVQPIEMQQRSTRIVPAELAHVLQYDRRLPSQRERASAGNANAAFDSYGCSMSAMARSAVVRARRRPQGGWSRCRSRRFLPRETVWITWVRDHVSKGSTNQCRWRGERHAKAAKGSGPPGWRRRPAWR